MKIITKNCLIVFIKNIKTGKVKTRLAKTVGTDYAVKFYEACVKYTLSEVSKLTNENIDVCLFFSSFKMKNNIDELAGHKFSIYEQEGKDLGEKMNNAFQKMFKNGSRKVVVIGTDLPDITAGLIVNSFKLLDESEVVIGPSNDGGYYLLGMNQVYSEIFTNMGWSTNRLLINTLRVLEKDKVKTKLLEEFIDIDTEADLRNWINKNQNKDHNFFNILKSEGLINKLDKKHRNQ